jgi:hypothetical protein
VEKLERDYARAIAERDEAIAERDFILQFLQDMGADLCKGRALGCRPTADGVEIRSLYPSQAEALAAASRIRELRAMVSLADDGANGAERFDPESSETNREVRHGRRAR